MSHLILSHLSANNNKPEIVDELFNSAAGGTKIVIASRKKETELFHISGIENPLNLTPRVQAKQKQQLSLFDA